MKMQGRLFQHRYRNNLQSWISYRTHDPYYQYLWLITRLIQSVFKQERTVNTEEELTKAIALKLNNKDEELLRKLIHSITLLNHTYRVLTLEGYESSKEDVLNAARLLQLKINPESLLFIKTKYIHHELMNRFNDELFTVKQASQSLLISKKTMGLHLRSLRNTGYVNHVKTGKNNTYYYQLS